LKDGIAWWVVPGSGCRRGPRGELPCASRVAGKRGALDGDHDAGEALVYHAFSLFTLFMDACMPPLKWLQTVEDCLGELYHAMLCSTELLY
jgi:hypothetical protein